MVARNFYIFLHNLIIFPIVLICVQRPLTWESLYLIPGLAILLLNLLWASLSIGIICSRYRDLTQIMTSILQIFFYVTPIIWMPSALPARASLMVLDPNPFYHFMQILRCPLLGESPTSLNWGITLLITIVGWVFAGILFVERRRCGKNCFQCFFRFSVWREYHRIILSYYNIFMIAIPYRQEGIPHPVA